MEYVWRTSTPGERFSVTIANVRDGEAVFDAGLALRRREIRRGTLTPLLVRRPLGPIGALRRSAGRRCACG